MIDYTLPLDELPDPLPIEPLTKPFDVTITPPGSKSITCRAYVLAALAEGESKIIRPLRADDTDKLLDALCTLGAEARWEGEDVYIMGVAGRFPRGGEVNLGDGGTPARFMIACACLAAEPVVVDGSPRMRERPVAEGVDMLRELGATIEYVEGEGQLPVRVVPSDTFNGGELTVGRTSSSQFISALLLIAPCLPGGLNLTLPDGATSWSYLDLTWYMCSFWGIQGINNLTHDDADDFFWKGSVKTIEGKILPQDFQIEPDASSALYWLFAATLCRDSRVFVTGITEKSLQPDATMILEIEVSGPRLAYWYQEGRDEGISIEGTGAFERSEVEAALMPDGAVALAAACAMSDGEDETITITGLHTLRVKETDRLAALENELTKIGCTVSTTDDSITIDPSTRHDNPVIIETYSDHRMAMAFAVLGLARPGISIANPKCVAKSYPGFWKDFARLYA